MAKTCRWLILTHLFSQPLFFVALYNTITWSGPLGSLSASQESQLSWIGMPFNILRTSFLTAGFALGTYGLIVQVIFATTVVLRYSKARTSASMKLFEAGLFIMVPLLMARFIFVVILFYINWHLEPW
jgi:hypothetical protein